MHIVFTGGGTGGHVVPNLALIAGLTSTDKVSYIGSYHGPERELVQRENIEFYAISTGKLRRYFDLRTMLMPFKVLLGIWQAWRILGKLKPELVFSKGGFVAVPVVFAAWLRGLPCIIHESDATPGLATKLCAPFASKILLGFATDSMPKYAHKMEVTGNPVRQEILKGSRAAALKLTGFSGERPVLLVMGGSSGAQELNALIAREEEILKKDFDIVHITGNGKGKACSETACYRVPYIHEELADIYAMTDVAISRAGAGSLAELEALGIPALLYPLGLGASRGDQIKNARALGERNTSYRVADPDQSAHGQLIGMPARIKAQTKSKAVEKILNSFKA